MPKWWQVLWWVVVVLAMVIVFVPVCEFLRFWSECR